MPLFVLNTLSIISKCLVLLTPFHPRVPDYLSPFSPLFYIWATVNFQWPLKKTLCFFSPKEKAHCSLGLNYPSSCHLLPTPFSWIGITWPSDFSLYWLVKKYLLFHSWCLICLLCVPQTSSSICLLVIFSPQLTSYLKAWIMSWLPLCPLPLAQYLKHSRWVLRPQGYRMGCNTPTIKGIPQTNLAWWHYIFESCNSLLAHLTLIPSFPSYFLIIIWPPVYTRREGICWFINVSISSNLFSRHVSHNE